MKAPPMSRAAAALLRALLQRAGADRDRILLTHVQSVDWQSLTFSGERHRFCLRLPGEEGAKVARRITDRLADVEFHLPGHIVADVASVGEAVPADDGSIDLIIEALTIAE